MLERMHLGSLELSKDNVTFLDVYCSGIAKWGLERGHTRQRSMFDNLSQIVIGASENSRPLATPILLPSYTLIERTELYGVNNNYLPEKVLSDVLGVVFMNTDIPLPAPRKGEEQSPKHSFIKFVSRPGQVGLDIQFEFPIEVALQVTKRIRDYLPAELLKQVTTNYRIPATT